MEWAVGMLTCPRLEPTIARALASLARAGWPEVSVTCDAELAGSWPTWYRTAERLLIERPEAEAILIVEDDGVWCRNLRGYLERSLWPKTTAIVASAYSPRPYNAAATVPDGWHEEVRGHFLVASLCWAMPAPALRKALAALEPTRHAHDEKGRRHIDQRIGRWALDTGHTIWHHKPSLVQHIANDNSALGSRADANLRTAGDFVGEDFDALDLLGAPPP